MHYYLEVKRRLNPINLVPDVQQTRRAMEWTMREMRPDMDFISAMVSQIPVLRDAVVEQSR
jgi:hypothetical protein